MTYGQAVDISETILHGVRMGTVPPDLAVEWIRWAHREAEWWMRLWRRVTGPAVPPWRGSPFIPRVGGLRLSTPPPGK